MDHSPIDDTSRQDDSCAVSKSKRGPILPSEEAQLPLIAADAGAAPAPPTAPLAEKIRSKRSRPLVSLSLFPESEPATTKKPAAP